MGVKYIFSPETSGQMWRWGGVGVGRQLQAASLGLPMTAALSTNISEKVIVTKIAKKFPTRYAPRKLITTFARPRTIPSPDADKFIPRPYTLLLPDFK